MIMTRFALAALLLGGMTQAVHAQYGPQRSAPAAAVAQPATHSPTARRAGPVAVVARAPQYVANKGVIPTPTPAAASAINGAVPGWTGSYGPAYSPGSYGPVGGVGGGPNPVVPVGPAVGGVGGGAGGPIVDGVDGGYAGGGSCGCGGGCGHGCGHGCCQTGCPGGCGCRWFSWKSPGDMPQHMPYFPNAHGYYYFRPYNVIHVLQQQEMTNRWGMDTRNPYDNRFFQAIYEQVEATLPPESVEPETAMPPVMYR